MAEFDGIIEIVVKDTHHWLGQLSDASTKKQVRLLELIAVNTEYAVTQIRGALEFEHTLEIFNQRGAKATRPFGAILINGRVLLANYTSSLGTEMNGVVVDKSFITHEVASWAEMGVKNNV